MNQKARPEWQIRQEKLTKIRQLGINPYPAETPDHQTVDRVRQLKEGHEAKTVGRVGGIRLHGKIAFLDLEDSDHKIQLLASQDNKEVFCLIELIDIGDYLWVKGRLFTTKAGELTLRVDACRILAKSLLPIPDNWQGLSDIERRYRQRALDFKVNNEARRLIKTRSEIVKAIRSYFENNDFLEIHTPVLQPIPGGAAAKPFVTHYNVLEADFYLRIAKELYLKRLIAGGFNRVFEIGPDFRNEGLSHMHNPEFYMCEAYWAYRDYNDFLQSTEELIRKIVKTVNGSLSVQYQGQKIDFTQPFAVKKYVELLKEDTGIDVLKEHTFAKLSAAVKKAGIQFENQQIKVWSELVDELFKKVSRPKIIQPTFVMDYPIETTPLAKRHRDNPKLAERFQLIAAGGFELVNAYSELNDPIEQEARFKEQMKLRQAGWEEAQLLDENYLEALKFGMPPTAGWGLGIERLTMILTNQYSIKEVIPFPTLRPKNTPKP